MEIFASLKPRANAPLVRWCLIILSLWGQGLLALPEEAAESEPQAKLIENDPLMSWRILGRFFRKHHNVFLGLGPAQGTWNIDHWGDLGQSLVPTESLMLKAHYTFHLPIYGSLGYMLGSSIGCEYETKSRDQKFVPGYGVQLPGVLVGGVYNISPEMRLSAGLDIYMNRFYGMKTTNKSVIWTIDGTMIALVDWFLGFDFFYEFNWAIRGEMHYRRLAYESPDPAVYTISNGKFEKEDQSLLLGVMYQWF